MSVLNKSKNPLWDTNHSEMVDMRFNHLSETKSDEPVKRVSRFALHEGVADGYVQKSNVAYNSISLSKDISLEADLAITSLSKIFIESLPLSESFKDDKYVELFDFFGECVKDDKLALYNRVRKTSNPVCVGITESVDKKIDDAGKKIASKKVTDSDAIIDNVKADANNTEVTYNEKEAADIVKAKVLSVIKSEEEENAKEKQMVQDIMDSRSDGNNVTVSESAHSKNSLFRSIYIGKYKAVLEAATTDQDGPYTLSESNEIRVDSESVLAESVMSYTALELLNTLNLTNYDVYNIRNVAEIASEKECKLEIY